MENRTANLSAETMTPELCRAEDPVEATISPPAAPTAGMSATETHPAKEPTDTASAVDRQMAEGQMIYSDHRPVAEPSAEKPHGRAMASPEGSIPQDCTMAMENNPVTTAGTSVLEAYENAADQETSKSSTKSESSATGWMMSTPAATPSRISFDGP